MESAWRVVQPVLDDSDPVSTYARGSWGPIEADRILGGAHWHEPMRPA